MAADDLFNVIPVPSLSATDLGVPDVPPPMAIPALAPTDMGIGPPPTPPVPVSTPVAHPQHGLSLALLALAGALGPKYGNGIPQGVVRGQDEARSLAQDQANKDAIQNAKQQAIYEQAQAKQQQAVDVRQKTLEGAVTSLRSQLSKVTDPKEYQTQVQGFANLMQASGYRVDANWVRQVAPYVAPSAQQRASTLLDKAMENPLTKAAMQQDPGKVIAGKISFDANGDGTPELYTIGELAALAGRPMITDPQTNQPIIPSKDQGKVGDAFQELLGNARATFRATNNRAPTAQEDAKLIDKAVETSKEKPPSDNTAINPDDVQGTAQAILAHRMAPSQLSLVGGMGQQGVKFKQAVMGAVLKQDPTFDFQAAESNYSFGKSAGTQSTVRYIDNIAKTIPMLRTANQTFKRSNVQSINSILRSGKAQFGNVDVADFDFKLGLIQDELAKTLQGGGTGNGTSDAKLRQAQALIGPNMTPAQLDTVLNAAEDMLKVRRQSLTSGTYMQQPDPAQTGLDKLNGR